MARNQKFNISGPERWIPILVGLLVVVLFSACQSGTVYRVTDEVTVQKPVSPLLHSNFIELGYGLQVESMWGEMLFNRSFETFTPYRPINKIWFDLYRDKARTTFKTDWSGEEWYHTGYEHNPWFAAPGNGGSLPIDDSSTFFISSHPDSPVIISLKKGGVHGDQHLLITNSGNAWGGVAQEGKYIVPGSSYHFSGYFDTRGLQMEAELRIYPEGAWDEPLSILPVSLNPVKGFQKIEMTHSVEDYEGRVTLAIWIGPGVQLAVDAFSMMPENTVGGWRPDAIECATRVNPGIIRIPGGCFASFYNWRDGIGPVNSRVPQPSYFWGGFNYNDVGVAELANFASSCGAGMMYCLNLYHPFKEEWSSMSPDGRGSKTGYHFTQFTDPEEGAREAANLVAYCNLPAGKHPMADLRVSHGFPEPFGIEYWEMDNEVSRWFSHLEYAKTVALYSSAMRQVDPNIKVGLVTYGGQRGEAPYSEVLEEMLEICGTEVDFLADRRGAGEDLDEMLLKMRKWNQLSGQNLTYCNTEKLFYEKESEFQYPTVNDEQWINRSYMFGTWYYALNVIRNYMAFQRRGGDIGFVNFNNLANTHNQSVLNTPKEGAYLSASGVALELLSRAPVFWPLAIQDYKADVYDEFQVQAAFSEDKESLVLYVFNRTGERRVTQLDIANFRQSFTHSETSVICADDPYAINSLQNPDAISLNRSERNHRRIKSTLKISSDPYSFTQIILK